MTMPNLDNRNPHCFNLINEIILSKVQTIEAWFRGRWHETPAPLMSSVDLRNAGFKLAPVDTNLFPAGFNNLSEHSLPLCVQAIQAVMNRRYPSCTKILLVPENHTRNLFYQKSLMRLHDLFLQAGFQIKIGRMTPEENGQSKHPNEENVFFVERIIREGDRLKLPAFDPCMVLLNNDLSSGVDPILKDIVQLIQPPLRMGWHARRKSNHFKHYKQVAEEFSAAVGIDTWFINPAYRVVDDVNFMSQENLPFLAAVVDEVLSEIRARYETLNIKETPYVVIKADNGTYGMGIMTAYAGDDVLKLNRKQRTKMSATKGSQQLEHVIVQEGVHSFEKVNQNAVAEPVVYMIGEFVVGGFYRVHQDRRHDESLNAPGMYFEPLPFSDPCNLPVSGDCHLAFNQFYVYGVIARLAALAAAREIAE